MTEVKKTKSNPASRFPGPGPGRPKGMPNKVTADLKSMILKALDDKGGADYLARQADENPTAFLTLVGKVLPMTIGGEQGTSGKLVVRWET
jgi:hypothetical protein